MRSVRITAIISDCLSEDTGSTPVRTASFTLIVQRQEQRSPKPQDESSNLSQGANHQGKEDKLNVEISDIWTAGS